MHTCIICVCIVSYSIVIGFDFKGDLQKICNTVNPRLNRVKSIIDLKLFMDEEELWPTTAKRSLHTLALLALDKRMDKSQTRSHWGHRPLSKRQLSYAGADAMVLVDIYQSDFMQAFAPVPQRIMFVEIQVIDLARLYNGNEPDLMRTVLANNPSEFGEHAINNPRRRNEVELDPSILGVIDRVQGVMRCVLNAEQRSCVHSILKNDRYCF